MEPMVGTSNVAVVHSQRLCEAAVYQVERSHERRGGRSGRASRRDEPVELDKKIIQITGSPEIPEEAVRTDRVVHFAEDVFQGSGVDQLENPGLLKPELPEYFLSCASSWNYPVYVPDVLVGVVFVRERRRQKYRRTCGNIQPVSADDERSASTGAEKYLRRAVAFRPHNVILTEVQSHIQQKNGKLLFAAEYRVIGINQKNHLYIHIVIK